MHTPTAFDILTYMFTKLYSRLQLYLKNIKDYRDIYVSSEDPIRPEERPHHKQEFAWIKVFSTLISRLNEDTELHESLQTEFGMRLLCLGQTETRVV